jgi:signal transduction histidine kinase
MIISLYYTVINIIVDRAEMIDVASLLPLFGIIVCAVLIIVWWRTGINKTYRDYLVSQDIEEFNAVISAKDARIAEVEKSNDYLSRQLHADNKLIPALQNAVRTLCNEYSKELASDILIELDRVSTERRNALHQYKKTTQKLPSTGITSLDIMLDYMKQKACDNGIEFDIIINGSIKHMVENLIPQEQLRTMTADLLENAIIATKSCDTRQILFTIGIVDDCYAVQVEDSGVDFAEDTLRDLGTKRTTTHANEGGSGIGMMEVFEVMRSTGASLYIEKLEGNGRGFTKRVAVRFDGKCEYNYGELLPA